MRAILGTLALVFGLAAHAEPIYITSGTFEWAGDPADADAAEAGPNIEGLGSDSVDLGIGINGSDPNSIGFTGVSGPGSLPVGEFNAGSLSVFNGAIGFNPNFPFSRDLILRVNGSECIFDIVIGNTCTQVAVGDVLISFIITRNSDDPVASADGICIQVASGNEECAWQFEQTTQTFDIIGAFGSFTVASLLPTSPGAFVTIGRDPTQNVIRRVPVPEPPVLSLLAIGLLSVAASRRRRR